MSKTVSAVLTTYNGADSIANAVASINNQILPPAEIVIVDDCSKDNTRDVIESLAQNSRIPINFIRLAKNTGGPAKPLNIGIEAAKYDVLVLLDQDDLMRPRRIEAQLEALVNCSVCSIVLGRFTIIGNEVDDMSPMWPVSQLDGLEQYMVQNRSFSVISSENAFKPLLTRNYAGSVSNFCFTRQWWLTIGKFNERVSTCVDLDFILNAAIAAPIAIVNEHVFDYRFNAASLQHRDSTRSLLEATMVRLRAASRQPDWAGDELARLRHSALTLANESIRNGDLGTIGLVAEILSKHNGFSAVKQSILRKTKRGPQSPTL
jgi:glycosyltransferase involved in cell wall biosynthesis